MVNEGQIAWPLASAVLNSKSLISRSLESVLHPQNMCFTSIYYSNTYLVAEHAHLCHPPSFKRSFVNTFSRIIQTLRCNPSKHKTFE